MKQSKNGIITYCNHSKLFQLVYNNLCFELYEWELDAFKKYVKEIDVTYWIEQLKCTPYQKKIPITTGTKHLMVLVDRQELSELRSLLDFQDTKIELLKHNQIDYKFLKN